VQNRFCELSEDERPVGNNRWSPVDAKNRIIAPSLELLEHSNQCVPPVTATPGLASGGLKPSLQSAQVPALNGDQEEQISRHG
jgi:hypothetical protein